MKKKKKQLSVGGAILTVLLIILAPILIAVVGAYIMFASRISAANSVKKLQDTLYCMEFKGDYGFEGYLEKGGASSDAKMAEYIVDFLSNGFYKMDTASLDTSGNFGCAGFKALDENGTSIYGRNFDWEPCDTMIVHTVPNKGYESVSTCCLDFLGFGEEWVPEGMVNQMMALASIYVPMDGMNEKGVVIADLMAGDKVETHQDTEKKDLTTTAAIRLVLDYAATVDEAIDLLEQYDMNSAIASAHHYYLADASGKSVVVEYVDNEMVVTETPVLTNHYLTEAKKGVGSENSHGRFDLLMEELTKANGTMPMEQLVQNMKSVCCGQYADGADPEEKTVWTCCYNTKDLTVDLYYLENYDSKYTMSLGKGSKWIQ